ncbi:DoxX family protein [bacterium]|nr:DoxX family protein [bacterium]
MTKTQTVALFILRLVFGWLFLYSGVSKLLDPNWSAESYLAGAKNFTAFYDFLMTPALMPFSNGLNAWGQTLIGLSLVSGIALQLSSLSGALLMILYYLPLGFPYPNSYSFVVDEHIIYAAALVVIATFASTTDTSFQQMYSKFRKERTISAKDNTSADNSAEG